MSIMNIERDVQREFDSLSGKPWVEYVQEAYEHQAIIIMDDLERSGREPSQEELETLKAHYA